MPKQFVSRWLIDMLNDGPYRDEREIKAEQREIRANARSEVDKIWDEQQKKLAPPPVEPLAPPPSWGTAPSPTPLMPGNAAVSTSSGNPPFVESPPTDPGIGVASRLNRPLPSSDAPPPLRPDYWS